jgi:hypothetical protein
MSASEYRTRMTQIRQQASTAQSDVALGLQAKSLAELRDRLDAFAVATQHIGDEVAKLNPPQNAETANNQLANGMHETARATRVLSKDIAGLHTAAEAIAYIEHSPNNAKGAREVNAALVKLKQLGYVSSTS